MTTVVHVAPHADDETLGCGGTLLRHIAEGEAVHWVLLTRPGPLLDVDGIAAAFGFHGVHRLDYPDAALERVPLRELIERLGAIVAATGAATIYLPHPADAHTDHRVAFEAGAACAKQFRYPHVRQLLTYETGSETDFGVDPSRLRFVPNVFVDISAQLERKLELLRRYPSEIGRHPFPRSEAAVRARALLHGAAAGCPAAEAFALLKAIR